MIYVLAGLNVILIACALWNEARINSNEAELRRLDREIEVLSRREPNDDGTRHTELR